MKKVVFERSAFEDFTDWATTDKNIYRRIVALILDALREPFSGLGIQCEESWPGWPWWWG